MEPSDLKKLWNFLSKEKKVKMGEMEEKLGIPRKTLEGYLYGQRRAPEKFVESIKSAYPHQVALFMAKQKFEEIKPTLNVGKGKPHLPFDAVAGYMRGLSGTAMEYDCDERPQVWGMGDYDFTATVKGDSMMPEYMSGDTVACIKQVSKIPEWGKVYLVSTLNDTLIKRLYPGSDDDHIKLVSDNKEKYPPMEVAREEVKDIAKVIGLIRSC